MTPSTTNLANLKPGHEYPGANFNARTTGRDQDIDALANNFYERGNWDTSGDRIEEFAKSYAEDFLEGESETITVSMNHWSEDSEPGTFSLKIHDGSATFEQAGRA